MTDRAAVAALVEDERVHRDLYLSEALFALEQKHFFANTWTYVGHASQVPNAGDHVTVELAGRPLVRGVTPGTWDRTGRDSSLRSE